MGKPTGRPNGRPPKGSNGLPPAPNGRVYTPGSKEAGELVRSELAARLLADLPIKERSRIMADLGRGLKDEQEEGEVGRVYSAQVSAQLAAMQYINAICGVVTAAQEKGAEIAAELPQILIAPDAPPPKAGSVEALKLLSAAKGSQYDEAFPSSPPPAPEPPKPMVGEVKVTVPS